MANDNTVYRVTGASDLTFRKLSEAVHKAAVWLDAFGSVWVTVVQAQDHTLHFIRDERGLLTVEVSMSWRGSYFFGAVRSVEDAEAGVLRALETYGLT